MRFDLARTLVAGTVLAAAACGDSKADLRPGAYAASSDCAGATSTGTVTMSQESPNVFRAVGATSFGLPDELLRRSGEGRLESASDARTCRARAYGAEKTIMFVCFALDGRAECTVLLEKS